MVNIQLVVGLSKLNQQFFTTMTAFSKNLIKFRNEKGLTQKELAEKLGIKNQSVSKWEKGEALPKGERLMKLCEILGVTPNQLSYEQNGSGDGVIDLGEKVVLDKAVWEAKEKELEYLRAIYDLNKQKEERDKKIESLKNIETPVDKP
ncbi:helix-turn-helix transcriptional regulator [Runella sp. MFBS21]|uniref:helix-turn-helix domain-containing protein n=1 Tax=Runella sp. MFBS21 TaxID=3034018 RepID=UPI0023FA128D|nr:helix-turn-helix transcriptional regulator [Runella sp. MFBS21]MDF7817399.1 helix-turn-helix transcriptional regulator [Runella sp. MFBS21]